MARAPKLPHAYYSYLVFQDGANVHLYRASAIKGVTNLVELATAPFPLTKVGESHTYKADYTADTGLLHVYVDGAMLLSAKDPSPLMSIGAYVVLFNNKAQVKFDDLSVTSLTKEKEGVPVPDQVITTSNVYHTHSDHLGSSSVITGGLQFDGVADATSTGVVVEQMDNYPYGETKVDKKAGTFATKKGYTGKELDADTGLYYYGARYYDARLGRFASEDPSFLNLGDSRSLVSPQGWNSYSYAVNNPVRYTDPSGGQAKDATMQLTSFSIGSSLSILFTAGMVAVTFGPMYGDTPIWAQPTISPADIQSAQSTDDVMLQRVNRGQSLIGFKGMGGSIKARMKVASGGGGTGNPGHDPDDDKNPVPKSVRDQIPKEWGEGEASNKGDGWRWRNPKNPNETVRYSKAKPNSPWESQKRPYVKQTGPDGQPRDISGNPINGRGGMDPGDTPESHIPVDQWKFKF